MTIAPLARVALKAAELVAAHPAQMRHANKLQVYAIACPPGAQHAGTITVARWPAAALPSRVAAPTRAAVEVRPDVFAYGDDADDALAWHLNFADERLFYAYGSGLLAQDEMQVAEHPALASVAEWLATSPLPGLEPRTRDASGAPTPLTLRGVERRCAIATDANTAEGRPDGLYGNRFARATPDVVRAATRALAPPTITHVLAMEALPGGRGVYTRDQIVDVATTAYTGFAAARSESRDAGASRTIVHTGHWGTGAYGGNRVLMAALQMFAAHLAGIDALVFHAFDEAGTAPAHTAKRLVDDVVWPCAVGDGVAAAIDALEARTFEWGVSDGN